MKRITWFILFFLVVASVRADPIFEASTSVVPALISPGSEGYIQVVVSNFGMSYIDKVEIFLSSIESPLTLLTPRSINLGGVSSGKSVSSLLKFSVPSYASPGFYLAKIIVRGCEKTECGEKISYASIVIQTTPSLEVQEIVPNKLRIGEIARMNLTLRNMGNSEVNNLIISWSNPVITPLGSSNRILVDSIRAGEIKTVSFDVVVNPSASPGVYPFYFLITYYDRTGAIQTINSSAGVMIVGDFNFILTLESQEGLIPGKLGKIDVKISNAGSQDSKFLVLKTFSSRDFVEVFPEVIYIGDLKSDDYDVETINLRVSSSLSEGNYPLELQLSYKDIYGNGYVENRTLVLKVSKEIEKKETSPLIYLLILILAIAFYFKFLRKR